MDWIEIEIYAPKFDLLCYFKIRGKVVKGRFCDLKHRRPTHWATMDTVY